MIGGVDLDVPDLGVTGQLPLHPEAVAQQLDQQRVLGDRAHRAQLDVGGQRPAEDVERLLPAAGAEVVGALRLDGQGRQLVGHEAEVGGHRGDRVEDLLHVRREHRCGQVVQDDVRRTFGHAASLEVSIMADLWSTR